MVLPSSSIWGKVVGLHGFVEYDYIAYDYFRHLFLNSNIKYSEGNQQYQVKIFTKLLLWESTVIKKHQRTKMYFVRKACELQMTKSNRLKVLELALSWVSHPASS